MQRQFVASHPKAGAQLCLPLALSQTGRLHAPPKHALKLLSRGLVVSVVRRGGKAIPRRSSRRYRCPILIAPLGHRSLLDPGCHRFTLSREPGLEATGPTGSRRGSFGGNALGRCGCVTASTSSRLALNARFARCFSQARVIQTVRGTSPRCSSSWATRSSSEGQQNGFGVHGSFPAWAASLASFFMYSRW